MGSFAIACVLGFLLYQSRRVLPGTARGTAIGILLAATIGIIVLAWVAAKLLFSDYSPDGIVARFIFGGGLGYGLGHVIAENQRAPSLLGRRRGLYLATGLTLILLAIVAPHLDTWLSRLNGFKTSIVEVQLTNISTAHKSILPDSRESFLDDSALQILKNYETNIAEDIAFIELFVIPDLESQKEDAPANDKAQLSEKVAEYKVRLGLLTNIRKAFDETLAPLAGCLQDAIKGGLPLASARGMVRPITDEIQQIFILEQSRSKDTEKITSARQQLASSLSGLPVENYLSQDRCLGDLRKFTEAIPPYSQKEYANLPQLYVATALLLLFVNSDEVALKMLEEAKPDPEFHDYTLPFLHSKIMYFFGEPVANYKPLLDQMIATARHTLDLTEKVKSRCQFQCERPMLAQFLKLQERALRSERIAMNSIAYGIAQDLAARVASAEPLEPIAQEYAEQLTSFIKKGQISNDNENDETTDTVAFVTLVVEGRKSVRDTTKIKNAIATLRRVVAHQEQ